MAMTRSESVFACLFLAITGIRTVDLLISISGSISEDRSSQRTGIQQSIFQVFRGLKLVYFLKKPQWFDVDKLFLPQKDNEHFYACNIFTTYHL